MSTLYKNYGLTMQGKKHQGKTFVLEMYFSGNDTAPLYFFLTT